MVGTITLSLPAVDVLGATLKLDVRQYPFEVPRLADHSRDGGAAQIWSELEAAGLATAGRPEPEVEDALYLMSGSEVAIGAAGLLDIRGGQRLAARLVATGEVGVVGVVTRRGLQMEFMAPEQLPGICAQLLPQVPAGAGRPLSAPAERSLVSSEQDASELSAIESVTSVAKHRIGHFVVSGSDRRGMRSRLPGLGWFDTDQGRYTLISDKSSGSPVISCTPADRQGIAEQVAELLERLVG